MVQSINITFAHDYDSNLYMLTKDPNAQHWQVIVHCKDGQTHRPSPEKFTPYPGCEPHEGEAAWYMEYYKPEKIEIERPYRRTITIKHPDAPK